MSTIILIMCKAIDASLLEDQELWGQLAYGIFDEMASRGNAVARIRKGELQKLASALEGLPPPKEEAEPSQSDFAPDYRHAAILDTQSRGQNLAATSNMGFQPIDSAFWPDETTAEQLMMIANSLDMEGFDWMTTSLGDSSAQSQIL
jgi:proline utilization trans-activator